MTVADNIETLPQPRGGNYEIGRLIGFEIRAVLGRLLAGAPGNAGVAPKAD